MPWTHAAVWLIMLLPPPSHPDDVDRFPGEDAIGCQRAINRQHAEYAELLRTVDIDHWDTWAARVGALEAAEEPWGKLALARWHRDDFARDGQPYSLERCLELLDELRGLIGEANYAAGQMPPAVPPAVPLPRISP